MVMHSGTGMVPGNNDLHKVTQENCSRFRRSHALCHLCEWILQWSHPFNWWSLFKYTWPVITKEAASSCATLDNSTNWNRSKEKKLNWSIITSEILRLEGHIAIYLPILECSQEYDSSCFVNTTLLHVWIDFTLWKFGLILSLKITFFFFTPLFLISIKTL